MAEAFARGDVHGMLCYVGSHHRLAFVYANAPHLKEKGLYETALVDAYTGANMRMIDGSMDSETVFQMFLDADRERLRMAGSAFPDGSMDIYRGVSGEGSETDQGWSWTSSIQVACWFAAFHDRPKPLVFGTVAEPDEVLFAWEKRQESEIVIRPDTRVVMKISESEIAAFTVRQEAKIRRDTEAILRGDL